MEKIKPAKEITPLDVARFVGNEKEYKDALLEAELKKNYDIIMGEFENEKNNIINEHEST